MKKLLIAVSLLLSMQSYSQNGEFRQRDSTIRGIYSSGSTAAEYSTFLLSPIFKELMARQEGFNKVFVYDSATRMYGFRDYPSGGGGVSDGNKGDITISGSGATYTVNNDIVTFAKMQNITTSRFLGRTTASTGDVEELTGTQATALLDVFTTSVKGLVPAASGGSTTTEFLRKDGSWQVPAGGGGGSGITIGTTAITSGTVGRILFEGSGNVVQQSANIFWDNTNKFLGVGTSTPASPVDIIHGTGTSDATIQGLTAGTTNTSYPTKSRWASNYNQSYFTQNASYNGSGWVADNTSLPMAGIIFDCFNSGNGSVRIHTSQTNNAGIGTETATFLYNGTAGFGVTTPTAFVHITAGTTSTPPLKFISGGTFLTTPQAGSMEYDGVGFYLSPSTIRKRIPLFTNAVPGNGEILIGNGTDFTKATLASADGSIAITNGAGAIDLATTYGVKASGDLVGQTTTQNLVSYTTPNNGLVGIYKVSAMVTVTAVSAGVLTTTLTYTDETNASRTITYFGMGATSAGLTTTGKSNFPPADEIHCQPNTAITVTTTLTVGTATFNGSSTVMLQRTYAL